MEFETLAFKYWIEALFGALTGFIAWGYRRLAKKLKQEQEQNKALKDGVEAILRDRIIQLYNHYSDKGYCPIYALDNAHSLYNAYKGLGGNGTITKLIEELDRMPHERKEKKI